MPTLSVELRKSVTASDVIHVHRIGNKNHTHLPPQSDELFYLLLTGTKAKDR